MSMSKSGEADAQPDNEESFERFVRSELARYDSRIETLEDELDAKDDEIERLRERVQDLDARTDMMRLIEDSDDLGPHQRSTALLQHLREEARNSTADDSTAINRDRVERVLHYPDIDRTTFITDMKRCVKLVGDKDICWYEGRDDGETREARLVLDLTGGDLPDEVSTKSDGGA